MKNLYDWNDAEKDYKNICGGKQGCYDFTTAQNKPFVANTENYYLCPKVTEKTPCPFARMKAIKQQEEVAEFAGSRNFKLGPQ